MKIKKKKENAKKRDKEHVEFLYQNFDESITVHGATTKSAPNKNKQKKQTCSYYVPWTPFLAHISTIVLISKYCATGDLLPSSSNA